jgi:hypothetical protein
MSAESTTLHPKTQARLDWLAAQEIVISIAYGEAEGLGVIWSVNCLTRNDEEFARPQRAHDFDGAVRIALLHCIKLNFVDGSKVPEGLAA